MTVTTAGQWLPAIDPSAQFSDDDREAWSDLLYLRDLADAVLEAIDRNFRAIADRILVRPDASIHALAQMHGIHPCALTGDANTQAPPPLEIAGREEERRAVTPDDPPRQRNS